MSTIVDTNFFAQGTPPRPNGSFKWLTETYDGMESDLAQDAYASFYWKIRDRLAIEAGQEGKDFEPDDDSTLNNQIRADAVSAASLQLDDLEDGSQRAKMQLWWVIKQNQLFRMTPQEYDSIEEFLSDRVPRLSPTSGEFYDIKFIMDELFPLLERVKNGWKPKDIIALKDEWSKSRASIPYMRQLVREIQFAEKANELQIKRSEKRLQKAEVKVRSASTPIEKKNAEEEVSQIKHEIQEYKKEQEALYEVAKKKFQDGMDTVIGAITNPNVSAYDGENSIKNVLFNNKQVVLYKAEKFLTGNNTTVYMIEVPNHYERTFESMTKGLLEFGVYTDGLTLFKNALKKFFNILIP